jgi:integrase
MPHVRLFIVLAIATAARTAALLELTWNRCDFDRGLIDLRSETVASRRKGRATIPMNDAARAALVEARVGARTGFVIEWAGQRIKKIRRGISAAASRAGIVGVTPHVLRHTAAVWMTEAGHPMSEIAQYLGHADSRITERVYARYSPSHLRKAADALEIVDLRSAQRFI